MDLSSTVGSVMLGLVVKSLFFVVAVDLASVLVLDGFWRIGVAASV